MNDIIRKLVYEYAVNNAMKILVAKLPFLAWPLINPFVAYAVSKVANLVYDELARFVTFTLIDIQVGAKKDAYDKATDVLKDAIEKGDEYEIEKAKEEYKARLRALVKRPS